MNRVALFPDFASERITTAEGVVQRCFDPLALWQRIAIDVQGETLACGHYIPEEAPEPLLAKALPFLLKDD